MFEVDGMQLLRQFIKVAVQYILVFSYFFSPLNFLILAFFFLL
jgi:hypothetical protein